LLLLLAVGCWLVLLLAGSWVLDRELLAAVSSTGMHSISSSNRRGQGQGAMGDAALGGSCSCWSCMCGCALCAACAWPTSPGAAGAWALLPVCS
jgi:hypothetical protein